MSRARRLAEIAKANQPAFNSESGNHWWLADASIKPEPEPAAPAEEPAPVAASAAAASESTSAILNDAHPQHTLNGSSSHSSVPHSAHQPSHAAALPPAWDLISGSELTNGIEESRKEVEHAVQLDELPVELPVAQPFTPPLPEPPQAPSGAVSRLGALKEKFVRLGRKNRGETA